MTTPRTQSYANHRRFFALYHYVAMPILLANLVVTTIHAVRYPSAWTIWIVVVSFGLVAGLVASRTSALIVQSRLIALEMRLRLAATLPPELRGRISSAMSRLCTMSVEVRLATRPATSPNDTTTTQMVHADGTRTACIAVTTRLASRIGIAT